MADPGCGFIRVRRQYVVIVAAAAIHRAEAPANHLAVEIPNCIGIGHGQVLPEDFPNRDCVRSVMNFPFTTDKKAIKPARF